MFIESMHKSGNTKTSVVGGAKGKTLAEVTQFVMDHWCETERSLWDWNADRKSDGTVVVTLFTD